MYVSWNGLDPVAPTNLISKLTEGDCTTGGNTGQYTNCPGGRFSTTVSCIFMSNVFDIGTLSNAVAALTAFKYTINFSGASSGATWNIDYELWNATTNTKVGNLNAANSITGDGSVTCQQWTYRDNINDPDYTNLSGNHYIRIVFTTTNTNNTAGRCVKVDDIFFYYGILSSVDSGTGGLSKPTFHTDTYPGTINGSGELIADIDFVKSTQSSVSCTDSSGTGNTPLCKLSSVKGIYQVFRQNKSTEEASLVSVTNFTIPYQSGTYTYTVTDAKFEDSTYIYTHIFSYEDWGSDNRNLHWKAKQAAIAKVASTVNISYSAGVWHVNLSQPITGNIEVSIGSVYGSAYNNCSTEDENDYITQDIIVTPGNTYESLSTMGLITSNYFKVINSVNVNGATVSNGSTLSIAGHLITVEIANITCSPYDQPAPPEE